MKNDALAHALDVVIDNISLLDKGVLDRLEFLIHCEILDRYFKEEENATD